MKNQDNKEIFKNVASQSTAAQKQIIKANLDNEEALDKLLNKTKEKPKKTYHKMVSVYLTPDMEEAIKKLHIDLKNNNLPIKISNSDIFNYGIKYIYDTLIKQK